MAKKRTRKTKTDASARNLGRRLGSAMARIDRLKQQRAQLVGELQDVIETAQGLIDDLGGRTVVARRRVRTSAPSAKKRQRKVSAKARARMVAAARKRWARYRKGKKAAQ